MDLRAAQHALVAAIYADAPPAAVPGLRSARGLRVHRGNLAYGIAERLADALPATTRHLGVDNVHWLAVAATRRTPLSHASALPADGVVAVLSDLPDRTWLGELARFEWALYRARRMAGLPAMPADTMATALSTLADRAQVVCCPSTDVLALSHGVVSAWDGDPTDDGPTGVLVWHRDGSARFREIPVGLVRPMRAIGESPLGDVLTTHGADALADGLGLLAESGLITDVRESRRP
jgi:hypothetical protein